MASAMEIVMDDFFAKHAAGGPTHVVLTIVTGDGPDQYGVFSAIENAKKWVDGLPGDGVAIHTPLIIDVPEFGEARTNQ